MTAIVLTSVLVCMLATGPAKRNGLNLSYVHQLVGEREIPARFKLAAKSRIRSPLTRRSLARVAILAGDVDGAATALMDLGIDGYRFAAETGQALLSYRHPQHALTSFQVAQRIAPGIGDPLYFVGRTHAALGEETLAEESYAECATYELFLEKGLLSRCHLERGKILASEDRVAEARKEFALAEANPALYFDLGKAYQSMHDSGAALTFYSLASEHDPTNMWPYLASCEVLLWSGQLDEAADWCERAVSARPRSVTPYEYLARVYMAAGNSAQALEVLNTAVSLEPRRAGIHYVIATILMDAGSEEEALEPLRRAVLLEEQRVEYRLTLADLLLALGRRDEAVEHYEAALRIDPGNQRAQSAMTGLRVQ